MVPAASPDFIPAFGEWVRPHGQYWTERLRLSKARTEKSARQCKFAWTSSGFANEPSSQRVRIH